MGAISPLHLLIVLVVALIVIGPGKLPETGAAIGKALREFREASRDEPPAPPAGTPPAVDAPPTQAEPGSDSAPQA